MNAKALTAALTLTLSAATFTSAAWAKQDNTSTLLRCVEQDATATDGASENSIGEVGVVEIQTNAQGEPLLVEVNRKALNGFSAYQASFDLKTASITQTVVKNPVDANGESTDTWGIKAVQTITVKVKGRLAFQIKVNDHAYAGMPGSTITYIRGNKKLSTGKTGNIVDCSGRVLFPWNTGVDLEE